MNNFFDNKANTVDWVFNKPNKIDIRDQDNEFIQERLSEALAYKDQLREILDLGDDQKVKDKLISAIGFISVASRELRKRNIRGNDDLAKANKNMLIKINHFETVVIPNLKEKNKRLTAQLEELKGNNYIVEYLKTYIKNMVSEREYVDILSDLDDIK